MGGRGGGTPRPSGISRFLVGIVSLAVLSAVSTLCLWAVAYPLIRGWTPTAVVSGSMAPAINVGDIIVAAPIDSERLGPGAIIVFDDPSGPGFVTHRIVEVTATGDMITRGDANRHEDSTLISPDEVRGIGRLAVPLVGLPQSWAADGRWLHLVTTAATLMLALWSARWAVLDEFDPWHADRPEPAPAPVRTPRLSHFALPALSILVFGALAAAPARSDAVYLDPAESGTNSITASALFP